MQGNNRTEDLSNFRFEMRVFPVIDTRVEVPKADWERPSLVINFTDAMGTNAYIVPIFDHLRNRVGSRMIIGDIASTVGSGEEGYRRMGDGVTSSIEICDFVVPEVEIDTLYKGYWALMDLLVLAGEINTPSQTKYHMRIFGSTYNSEQAPLFIIAGREGVENQREQQQKPNQLPGH